jgi:hypothetical protein
MVGDGLCMPRLWAFQLLIASGNCRNMNLRDLLRHASPDVLDLNVDALMRPTHTPAARPATTEEQEQIRLFQMVEEHLEQYPDLRFLFHVPNGGHRSKATAGRLKAAGVKAGVPDLLLLVPRGSYHGMACELKIPGGRLLPSQRAWLEALNRFGYYAVVAFGADEALEKFVAYLDTNTC